MCSRVRLFSMIATIIVSGVVVVARMVNIAGPDENGKAGRLKASQAR